MKFEPVIGLEIHIELKTKTKMFCGSLNDSNEKHPNVNICPICMGHPGTLPVINKKAVEYVIKTGTALGSEIPEYSKFDRKNYFYPDLPKGYQISQYDKPLCVGGKLKIWDKETRITRVHLEEDTGKLIHPEGEECSLVDYNRAGVPLMELVTEPDIRSGKEARKFAEELQLILRYLGVAEANMEKGEMRVEANVSLISTNTPRISQIPDGKEREHIRDIGGKFVRIRDLGTKVEVKNLNSFKAVENAIQYEIKRQAEALENGEKIIQETRGWDEKKQRTFSQRTKEEAHDYRYFPEPDLPILSLRPKVEEVQNGAPAEALHIGERRRVVIPIDLDKIKSEIPELPQQRRERFKKEYGLKDGDIEIFVVNKSFGEYYEKVVSELSLWLEAEIKKIPRPVRKTQSRLEDIKGRKSQGMEDHKTVSKLAANYLISDLQKLMRDASATAEDLLITPENFAELVTLIHTGKVSSRVAKDVLKGMFGSGADPSHIIEEKGLAQVSDETELEDIVEKVIKNNLQAVGDYKKGKETSIQFLVGQIMRETSGAANPSVVRKIILEKIK